MSKIFSTNVFIKGFMAFYEVSTSNLNVYHLHLKICRLRRNPPPQFLRIQFQNNSWTCLDDIPKEFAFIAEVIGKRIQQAYALSTY